MMDKCPAIKKKVLRKFRVIRYQNEVSNNNQQLQKKFIRIVRPLTILSRSENELKSECLSFYETTSVVANGKQLVKKYARQTIDGEEKNVPPNELDNNWSDIDSSDKELLENITRNENCKITSSSTNLPSNYFWRVLRLHIEVIFRFKYLSNIYTSKARFDFTLTSANESYKPSKEDIKELNTVTSNSIERTLDASIVSLSDKSSSYSKNSMLTIENSQKLNNLIYKPTTICSELNDCTKFNTSPPNNDQVIQKQIKAQTFEDIIENIKEKRSIANLVRECHQFDEISNFSPSGFLYVLPLQSCSESVDRGDCWRVWSCIRLAYLIRDRIISSSKRPVTIQEPKKKRWLRAYDGHLKRRGRCLTRREGRCWQTVKEELLGSAINYEDGE